MQRFGRTPRLVVAALIVALFGAVAVPALETQAATPLYTAVSTHANEMRAAVQANAALRFGI